MSDKKLAFFDQQQITSDCDSIDGEEKFEDLSDFSSKGEDEEGDDEEFEVEISGEGVLDFPGCKVGRRDSRTRGDETVPEKGSRPVSEEKKKNKFFIDDILSSKTSASKWIFRIVHFSKCTSRYHSIKNWHHSQSLFETDLRFTTVFRRCTL